MGYMSDKKKELRAKKLAKKNKYAIKDNPPPPGVDTASKKLLKARVKKKLPADEEEAAAEEALQEVRREERKLVEKAREAVGLPKKKPNRRARPESAKGCTHQQRVVEWEKRQAAGKPEHQVYVGNLPKRWPSEEKVRFHFSGCGEIVDVRIPPDKNRRMRNYAFITFADADGKAKAKELAGSKMGGNELSVGDPSGNDMKPRLERKKPVERKGDPDLEVMFGNLSNTRPKRLIRKLIAECGETDRVFIPVDVRPGLPPGLSRRPRHKGVAFATFKTREGYDKALAKDGEMWLGYPLRTLKYGTEKKITREEQLKGMDEKDKKAGIKRPWQVKEEPSKDKGGRVTKAPKVTKIGAAKQDDEDEEAEEEEDEEVAGMEEDG